MKNLLNQINSIIKVYEKHTELSGEKFNVFSIMGMESDEVRTHSAILGELLNPKGSHSLGTKPLELFMNQILQEKDFLTFDHKSLTCQKEIYIGKINEDKSEGGRVDLIISDKSGYKIVIENKIYAPEQKNQLSRYYLKHPDAKILYLTLDGSDSKEKIDFNYHRISYEKDILEWIEVCAKEAFEKPMVREVLNQYAYLIRRLTNKSTNVEMSKEIVQVIKDNYKESLEIHNNLQDARISLVSDIFEELDRKKIELIGSGWNVKIDDSSKIWNIRNYKTILISNEEHSNIFFFIRYRYSSPKLSKGIVTKLEALDKIKELQIAINKRDNSILSEIMNVSGRNDLIVAYQDDPLNFMTTLLEEIKSYIEDNQKYFNEIKTIFEV